MNSFFHAIVFLTRIPLPVRLDKQGFQESRQGYQKSPMWFPLVGLILGALLFLFDRAVAVWFPGPLHPLLDLLAWFFLTGGLHLDGWMDMADGLGSNRDRDRILEIMRDSRVGAMGVSAAILLLMLKAGALIVLTDTPKDYFAFVLILSCVWGRMAPLVAIRFFPYARLEGYGEGMRQYQTWKRFGFAFLCSVLPTVILLGYAGLLAGLSVLVATAWIGWKVTRTIGGCTGDIYGAMIEAAELVWLLFFTIPEVQALCV